MNPGVVLRSMVVVVVALGAVLLCRFSPPIQQDGESGIVLRLPAGVGHFIGREVAPSEKEKEYLPGDTGIVKRLYYTAGAEAAQRDVLDVTLILAGAERRSIHRPEVCLTGQGWTILDASTVPIEIRPGLELKVRDLFLQKVVHLADGETRTQQAHYVYWFVGTDVTTPSNFERIWWTTWDSVARNVNHRWAYPSLLALVTEGLPSSETGQRERSSEETLAMACEMVKILAPTFQKNLIP
ncbi:MAG: exosortase-associated EpsI family protein [Verrucomicrobiales bacterium]|nr:exosortase-associated EpsI family protein [Verrucomicrobiales bacterium]